MSFAMGKKERHSLIQLFVKKSWNFLRALIMKGQRQFGAGEAAATANL